MSTTKAPPAPPPPKPTRTEPKKVLRSVKHIYAPAERQHIGDQLASHVQSLRAIDSEFEQVKAQFKARSAAAEAMIETLSTALTTGFEFKNKPCVLVMDTKRKRRVYFLEEAYELHEDIKDGAWLEADYALDYENVLGLAVAVEEMRPEDWQRELPVQEGGAK